MDPDEMMQRMYDLCVHVHQLYAEIVERQGKLEELLRQVSDLANKVNSQRICYLSRN